MKRMRQGAPTLTRETTDMIHRKAFQVLRAYNRMANFCVVEIKKMRKFSAS